MVIAMSVGGARSAFFPSQVWSRGLGIRTKASLRTYLPAAKAMIGEGESGGRELLHSSKRLRTICNVTADSANTEIESKEDTEFCLSGPPLRGKPLPFGATVCEEGVNFAVHSSGATAVALCLFTESDLQQVCSFLCFPMPAPYDNSAQLSKCRLCLLIASEIGIESRDLQLFCKR